MIFFMQQRTNRLCPKQHHDSSRISGRAPPRPDPQKKKNMFCDDSERAPPCHLTSTICFFEGCWNVAHVFLDPGSGEKTLPARIQTVCHGRFVCETSPAPHMTCCCITFQKKAVRTKRLKVAFGVLYDCSVLSPTITISSANQGFRQIFYGRLRAIHRNEPTTLLICSVCCFLATFPSIFLA